MSEEASKQPEETAETLSALREEVANLNPQPPLTATEVVDAALAAAAPTPKPLDPYLLFTQIENMRKEGVPEETIREAFNELMEERSGNFRKLVPTIKRTADSVPMPTQDDINKIYTEKALGKEILSQDMETILEELENSRIRRAQEPSVPILKFKQRLAQRVMMFMLGITIWVFKKLGVK